jgi:hypothetical protein
LADSSDICPSCIRKKRYPPNKRANGNYICNSCNYERVKLSTQRRFVKDVIESGNWTELQKKNRNMGLKIPYDVIMPFVKEYQTMADETLRIMESMELNADEQVPWKQKAGIQYEVAQSLLERRPLTDAERRKIQQKIQDQYYTPSTVPYAIAQEADTRDPKLVAQLVKCMHDPQCTVGVGCGVLR